MWCTRWYLPLILLPLPIAPPYFLALFLLSLTLHARPCFYCIVLLTALFLSTCYWPPISIETSLTTPWSENITTYADALLSLMPELPKDLIPSDIPIVDHCWCDLTSGKFFEPFDVTRWEMESVVRLKDELEMQQRLNTTIDEGESEEDKDGAEEVADVEPSQNTTSIPSEHASATKPKWSSILGTVWPFLQSPERPSPSSSVPSSFERVPESTVPITTETSDPSPPIVPQTVPPRHLPRLRREYDLRPYGFQMTVDFGWSRRS